MIHSHALVLQIFKSQVLRRKTPRCCHLMDVTNKKKRHDFSLIPCDNLYCFFFLFFFTTTVRILVLDNLMPNNNQSNHHFCTHSSLSSSGSKSSPLTINGL